MQRVAAFSEIESQSAGQGSAIRVLDKEVLSKPGFREAMSGNTTKKSDLEYLIQVHLNNVQQMLSGELWQGIVSTHGLLDTAYPSEST